MAKHPALEAGRAAVVTGAASGIGLAAAERLAGFGMKLCLVDIDGEALEKATDAIRRQAGEGQDMIAVAADVADRGQVERLKEEVFERFGEVAFLMNNAGREGGGQLFGDHGRWREIVETNLWGVIHGIQLFAPAMAAQVKPAAIVSTGSKQGITAPPGDTAYNVSKAGVKVVTEALAHELRTIEGCRVTAHLLVPGFTFTGFTRVRHKEKPAAAWMPEQVIDELLAGMARGDFYIICPDNDGTREMDRKRILWAAGDITENRPALSRWHPDYADAFRRYMEE